MKLPELAPRISAEFFRSLITPSFAKAIRRYSVAMELRRIASEGFFHAFISGLTPGVFGGGE